MRLAVLGAGAIGPAAAALAAARGHDAALWSPSGRGTAGVAGVLRAEGALAGAFPIRVAASLGEALSGADAALLAVPAYAYPSLLPAIASALPRGVPLLIAPAASLAPLAFDRLWAGQGAPADRAPVGGLATAPVTARRLGPDRVRVATIRTAVEAAAVPARAGPEIAALAEALFGIACPVALPLALANANPIIHAALALANVTRIERGEAWGQYEMMTAASCRLMSALEAERAALAAALGVVLPSLAEALSRANALPIAPLPAMGAAIAASRGAVFGPTSLETRYVTEDVPFGLAVHLRLAAGARVPMPLTEATVAVLEALWGRDLRANPLLDALEGAATEAALSAGFGR
ncbi:MAG: NAD/NADP octopine/nopaline dehydrogenase family protein [Acetobacteraceae bacterium]|nr:NAD/NADP octopine/nopaline dehydrogenase family protein [Acetobacteraceae bacterium]